MSPHDSLEVGAAAAIAIARCRRLASTRRPQVRPRTRKIWRQRPASQSILRVGAMRPERNRDRWIPIVTSFGRMRLGEDGPWKALERFKVNWNRSQAATAARRSSGAPAQARTLGSAAVSEKYQERFQVTWNCSSQRASGPVATGTVGTGTLSTGTVGKRCLSSPGRANGSRSNLGLRARCGGGELEKRGWRALRPLINGWVGHSSAPSQSMISSMSRASARAILRASAIEGLRLPFSSCERNGWPMPASAASAA